MVARPFRSRKPNFFKQKSSPLWKCFHAHFDHFTAAYPRDYQSRYGVLRGVIPEVVDKFMGCGDFAKGFARVRCGQRRKRAEEAHEETARKSAATAQHGCGALASAAIEIIEHRALKPRRIPSRTWRELIKLDHA